MRLERPNPTAESLIQQVRMEDIPRSRKSGKWFLEPTVCNLCGDDSPRTLFMTDSHGFGLRTVACERCGLVYLNPRPTTAEYRRFYSGLYEKLFPSGGTPGPFADFAAKQRLDWYKSFLPPAVRLLEVGPGNGAFMAVVRDSIAGAMVWGVEPSPLAAAACRRKNLHVIEGYLSELHSNQQFDTVAAFHVLEHSLNPTSMLLEIREHLRDGGHLLIEVPNIVGRWNGLGMLHIAHPYQYSPKTLISFLLKCGFVVEECVVMEQLGFECSFRVVAKMAELPTNYEFTGESLESTDRLHAMFSKRLQNWKKDLVRFKVKRSILRLLGSTMTRSLRGTLNWKKFQMLKILKAKNL